MTTRHMLTCNNDENNAQSCTTRTVLYYTIMKTLQILYRFYLRSKTLIIFTVRCKTQLIKVRKTPPTKLNACKKTDKPQRIHGQIAHKYAQLTSTHVASRVPAQIYMRRHPLIRPAVVVEGDPSRQPSALAS